MEDQRNQQHVRNIMDKWWKDSNSINILITGCSGVGKSSLVNAFLGKDVAAVGHGLYLVTVKVASFTTVFEGIKVTIWDSPGLQDGTVNDSEAEYLKDIKTQCKGKIDLFLYCVPMTRPRLLKGSRDIDAMCKLTDTLGMEIWDNTVFVLTQANHYITSTMSNMCGRDELSEERKKEFDTTIKKKFADKLDEWKSQVRKHLSERVGLLSETIEKLPILPAGLKDFPLLFKDCPDSQWLSKLWMDSLLAIRHSAQPALIKMKLKRLVNASDIQVKEYEEVRSKQKIIIEAKESAVTRAVERGLATRDIRKSSGFLSSLLYFIDKKINVPVIQVEGAQASQIHRSAPRERNHYQVQYQEIIKRKETVNIRSVRFVNIGIPRSGKTTFWRRLMKRIANMEENLPSTGVVEEQQPVLIRSVKEVKIGSGMITPDEWSELDEGRYATVLLNMFSQVHHDLPSADDASTESPESQLPCTEKSANQFSNTSQPSGTGQRSHQKLQQRPTTDTTSRTASIDSPATSSSSASAHDLEESFASIFNKASKDNWETLKCALEDIILLNTADTGGHTEFLDMHAALINGPSFNLIFSRLTDDLDSLFKVYYTDQNCTSTREVDSDLTVKEVIFQALSSVTSSSESQSANEESSEDADIADLRKALKSRESKLMFVGTFADKLSSAEFLRKDAKLKQKLDEELGAKFHKAIMYADHDKGQLMLRVNNKDGGEAEINKIRSILKEKIEKCFDPIPIPASWFVLGLLIRDHPHPTMTLKHCEELALKLNIEPGELQTALWFLHYGLGLLLYYPESSLKDIVFCKIQAIYQSITDLIKKSYTARYVPNESSLDEFKNLGLFSLAELKITTPDSPIPRDLLVQLLEHLNIITPAPTALSPTGISRPYFMPCKLRCSRKAINIPAQNPEPLKLHFKCGFTPMGVFPAVITKLFSQMKELNWEILKKKGKQFFKNRVKFRVGRDMVYLMSHLHYFEIAVVLRSPESTDPTVIESLCHDVRVAFEDALEKVTANMNFDFLGSHEYAFWCTECPRHTNKHLAVFQRITTTSDFMVCRRKQAKTSVLNTHQMLWFAKALKAGHSCSSLITEPGSEATSEVPTTGPLRKPLSQESNHDIQLTSDSPELKTIKVCTPQLETALKGLDRGLVHFMNRKGFMKDDDLDKILTPVTLWTDAQKAGELAKWIKNRVSQYPPSYHTLMHRLRGSGAYYQPIVGILDGEYARQVAPTQPRHGHIRSEATFGVPRTSSMRKTSSQTIDHGVTFNLKNVLVTLKDVSPVMYVKLAINLGLEPLNVERYEVDHPNNSEHVLIYIVRQWMNTVIDPTPSWQSLEEAIQGL